MALEIEIAEINNGLDELDQELNKILVTNSLGGIDLQRIGQKIKILSDKLLILEQAAANNKELEQVTAQATERAARILSRL